MYSSSLRGCTVEFCRRVNSCCSVLQVKLLDLDYVMFPLHINDMHWALGVINFREKRIEYYDSMNGCATVPLSVRDM